MMKPPSKSERRAPPKGPCDEYAVPSSSPWIPGLVGNVSSLGATHLKFEHFSGNIFNVSSYFAISADRSPDGQSFMIPGYAPKDGSVVEFVTGGRGGFSWSGIWGGDKPPTGRSVKERAEVWFDRVREL